MERDTKLYQNLHQTLKYKMIIKPGDDGSAFRFRDLCKSNGEHYLGNYPKNIEGRNCKKNLQVSLKLMEQDNNEWDQKVSLDCCIKSCQHEEECKFLNQHQNTE